VYDFQKGNTNDEIKFYIGYDEEKGKSHEDSLELRILYFIWVLWTTYYQGGALGESVKCKSLKSIHKPKFPEK
jgi:hypothetical protein